MGGKQRKKAKYAQPKRHLVIPDTQVRPGVRTDHLSWAGQYIADHRPDVIIQIGDWYDMQSLSSYDRGKRAAEGRRVINDINTGNKALAKFVKPWINIRGYSPRKVFCLGNHEQRIARYINDNPELEGVIGYDLFDFDKYGFECHGFLSPVAIDGIEYAHYFPQSSNGKVLQTRRGAPSAAAQVARVGYSCTAGHNQGIDHAVRYTSRGPRHGLIAGSFYQHDEAYMSPMGNHYWRGIVMKNQVDGTGGYDICLVGMDYLKKKYGKNRI